MESEAGFVGFLALFSRTSNTLNLTYHEEVNLSLLLLQLAGQLAHVVMS